MYDGTSRSTQLLTLIKCIGNGLAVSPKQLYAPAEQYGIKKGAVRTYLRQMEKCGLLVRIEYGRYRPFDRWKSEQPSGTPSNGYY